MGGAFDLPTQFTVNDFSIRALAVMNDSVS